MADRKKSSGRIVTGSLIVAGLILVVAGASTLFPAFSNQPAGVEPADFGESAPPVRPTVTPIPFASQLTAEPVQLPNTTARFPARMIQTPVPDDPVIGIPARLVIPAINLDAPIETVGWHVIDGVSTWDVPDHFAAGWLKTSALLGQVGNTVLDGHHNIAGEVFRHLVDLKLGDEIEVFANGQPIIYKVTTRKIFRERDETDAVRIQNAQWMQPTQDERLTLITCWPYTSNTHRLVIVARPFDPKRANIRQMN